MKATLRRSCALGASAVAMLAASIVVVIGMPRITAGIGLLNLVYNLARYEQILKFRLA